MSQFLTSIKQFANLIRDIQDSDRDALVVITGDTGQGKSVLDILLLKEIIPDYNPVKNLPFSREELNTLIETLPEGSGLGVDEAVGLFYSRDFHDAEQIALLKKLDRSRDRRLLISLLIPDFFRLDAAIRNARVRFWVWVDKRVGVGKEGIAHAYVFQKENNCFERDPWNLKLNSMLIRRGNISKSPNYLGEIEYRGLKAAEYAHYKRVKALKRQLVEIQEWEAAQAEKKKKKPRGEHLRTSLSTSATSQ